MVSFLALLTSALSIAMRIVLATRSQLTMRLLFSGPFVAVIGHLLSGLCSRKASKSEGGGLQLAAGWRVLLDEV